MAPRPLESKESFIARLRTSWRPDGSARIGVGTHHFTHGVVLEDGKLRIRELVLDRAKADEYRKKHGRFMPEHAEMLSEPTGAILYEAATLEELVKLIAAGRWPL